MKTFREYINLIESAQHGEPLAEGVMDRLRRIYMGLVYDRPWGTPDSEFLSQWQQEIKAQLGQDIDLDTLARLQQNFRERGQTMMSRGDAADYDREMGIREQGVTEGSETITLQKPFHKKVVVDDIELIARSSGNNDLNITAFSASEPGDTPIAQAKFWKEGSHLFSEKTFVSQRHQRKGIATLIYQFVKSLGFDIQPSKEKTELGQALWRGFASKDSLSKKSIAQKFKPGVAEGFSQKQQKELAYNQGMEDYEDPEVTIPNYKSWGQYAKYYIKGWKSAQELEAGSHRDELERNPERFDDEPSDEQGLAEDRSYQSKSQWMDEIRRLNPKVQFVDDDRGVVADQGPGKKIAGEWNDDFGSGVIYTSNIQPRLRVIQGVAEGSDEKYSYRVTFNDGTHNTVAIPVAKIFQGNNSAKDLIIRHFARKGRTVKDIEMMFRPDSVQEGDQELEETQQVNEDPVARITRLHQELNRR